MSIEAYAPGKSKAPPGVTVHKLSSNETPLGPSPKALAAAEAVMGKLALYPDGGANALRDAIAHKFGLDPARIVCRQRLGRIAGHGHQRLHESGR